MLIEHIFKDLLDILTVILVDPFITFPELIDYYQFDCLLMAVYYFDTSNCPPPQIVLTSFVKQILIIIYLFSFIYFSHINLQMQ